ncbi:MAG: cytochrome P460 family protein [Desulfuromonadaceae bacterium]
MNKSAGNRSVTPLSFDTGWFSRRLQLLLAVTVALLILSARVEAAAASGAAQFNNKGELLLPVKYRQWVFIGAPVTPNDLNDGKALFPEFHHIYIDPASFAIYKKTGKIPNGTVFVKELVDVLAKSSANGNGYFSGDFIGLFVSVKDAKRFPNEPGNVAFFDFLGDNGTLLERAKSQPTDRCNSCHKQWAAGDLVFSQYYPVLKAVIQNQ